MRAAMYFSVSDFTATASAFSALRIRERPAPQRRLQKLLQPYFPLELLLSSLFFTERCDGQNRKCARCSQLYGVICWAWREGDELVSPKERQSDDAIEPR